MKKGQHFLVLAKTNIEWQRQQTAPSLSKLNTANKTKRLKIY